MTTRQVVLKQGESKVVTLTIRDEAGALVDVSAATLTLGVKRSALDVLYAFQKADTDFNKANADDGVVTVPFLEVDTNQPEGGYIGELKAAWGGNPPTIEKSMNFYIQIRQAVIPYVAAP